MAADFNALASKAKESGDSSDMNNLWEATYDLDEWIFIAQGEEPNVSPFIGMLDDKPLIMAFTDEERAKAFAKTHGIEDEDGKVPLLGIPLEIAVKMGVTLGEHGVFGMLFNDDGTNGFFTPCANLQNMYDFFIGLAGDTEDPGV